MTSLRAASWLLLLAACDRQSEEIPDTLGTNHSAVDQPAAAGGSLVLEPDLSDEGGSAPGCPALVAAERELVAVAEPGEDAVFTVHLHNICADGPALTFEDLEIRGDSESFTLLTNLEELEIGPGESGEVEIAFAPQSLGIFVVDLDLTSSDRRVGVVPVNLIGVGSDNFHGRSGSPPNADAGADLNETTGTTVSLDGSGSSDPEGDALTYSWSFVSVASGSALTTASITNRTSAIASFVPDVDGAYRLRFVISDGTSTDKAFKWVWTTSGGNTDPVANVGSTVFATTGAAATLDASGSSDADGDPLTYAWSFVSVPSGSSVTNASIASKTSAVTSFTPDVDGDYRLRMVVSDGTATDKAFLWVRASGTNNAPTANAGANQTGTTGDTHVLDGSGSSDPDGDALSYTWTFQSVPSGSALTNASISGAATATPSFTSDVDGTYRLRMKVSDGSLTDKAFVNVVTSSSASTRWGSGATATGTTGVHAPDYLLGQQVTLSSAITLTGLGINIYATSGNTVIALYTDSSGSPGTLVAQTGSEALSVGNNDLGLSGSNVAVSAGTYWIMKVHDDVAYVTESSSAGSTNTTAYESFTFSSSVPDPAGSVSTLNDQLMALWLVGY